jgi:hypothetical protein
MDSGDYVQQLCDRGDCTHRACKIAVIASELRHLATQLRVLDKGMKGDAFLALCVHADSLTYTASKIQCHADAACSYWAGCELALARGVDLPPEDKAQ